MQSRRLWARAGAHLAKSQGRQREPASAQGRTRAAGGTYAGKRLRLQREINPLHRKVTLHKGTLRGDLRSGNGSRQPYRTISRNGTTVLTRLPASPAHQPFAAYLTVY